jgi:hypothetical protein
MAQATLEQRVETLERELAELKTAVANGTPVKDWRRTIGMFTDDPAMLEVFQEALKFREADRERARRRFAKEDKRKRRPRKAATARAKA